MVKKTLAEIGKEKSMAWRQGKAQGVFSTHFNLNPQFKVKMGPIAKDKHAQNFEHIVKTILHDPKSVTIMRVGDTVQLRIKDKEYNLSEMISKLDPRTLLFNDYDYRAYVDYAQSGEAKHHAMFISPTQLKALGQPFMLMDPTEEEFRALDPDNHFTNLHHAELIAVNIYTQKYYSVMNALMRGSSQPFEQEPFSDDDYEKDMKELLLHIGIASSGLSKTPVVEFDKMAYRYDDDDLPDSVRDARIASANSPNENKLVVKEQGFVSSSLNKPSKDFDGPHRTVFTRLIGCYIGPISFYPHERELLMPPTDIVYQGHKEIDGTHYYLARPVYTPRMMSERELNQLHEKTQLQLFDDMKAEAKASPDGIMVNESEIVMLLTQLEGIRALVNQAKRKGLKTKIFSNKVMLEAIEVSLIKIMMVDNDANLKPADKLATMSHMANEITNMIQAEQKSSHKHKILKKIAPKTYKKANLIDELESLLTKAELNPQQGVKKVPQPQKNKPKHGKPVLHKQQGGKLQVTKLEPESFLASKTMQDAISHVFDQYLNVPYSNDIDPITNKSYHDLYKYDWQLKADGTVIPRPNHNIAHTLRGVWMLEPIIAAYNQGNPDGNTADRDAILRVANDPLEVKRMQVALLFSVVGRLNDMGFADNPQVFTHFRERSVLAFKQYAREHCQDLFPDEVLDEYAEYLRDFGNPSNNEPHCILMRQCHRADLPRCYNEQEFEQKVMTGADWDDHSFVKDFGEKNAKKLLAHSLELIKATGDRNILDDGHDYNLPLFKDCNTSPQKCQQALDSVGKYQPAKSKSYKA